MAPRKPKTPDLQLVEAVDPTTVLQTQVTGLEETIQQLMQANAYLRTTVQVMSLEVANLRMELTNAMLNFNQIKP